MSSEENYFETINSFENYWKNKKLAKVKVGNL